MSSDLTRFLVAGLDEDEAAAKAAPGSQWHATDEDSVAGAAVYDEQWVLLYPEHYDHDNALSAVPGATGPQYIEHARDELAAHIARHDPARVLREVTAKQVILALHRPTPMRGIDAASCVECRSRVWPCPTVKAVATIYQDSRESLQAAQNPAVSAGAPASGEYASSHPGPSGSMISGPPDRTISGASSTDTA